MTEKEINRHLTQSRFIIEHRYRYYVWNLPVLLDEDFDKAIRVLEALESKNPALIHPNSPTQYPEEPPIGWAGWFNMPKWLMRERFYDFPCKERYPISPFDK